MLPSKGVTRRADSRESGGVIDAAAPTRLVLDTNTVLDWLVFNEPSGQVVGHEVSKGRMRWLTTPRMLDELRAVLARPLPHRWEPARERALTCDLAALTVVCSEPTTGLALVCRDATDQVFIDLACQHSPSLLLTRDRALLALRRRARDFGVRIATAAAWLATRPQP